jgi:hypothetical protein
VGNGPSLMTDGPPQHRRPDKGLPLIEGVLWWWVFVSLAALISALVGC